MFLSFFLFLILFVFSAVDEHARPLNVPFHILRDYIMCSCVKCSRVVHSDICLIVKTYPTTIIHNIICLPRREYLIVVGRHLPRAQ